VLPFPTAELTDNLPPFSSTSSLHKSKLMPVPLSPEVPECEKWVLREKSFSISSASFFTCIGYAN